LTITDDLRSPAADWTPGCFIIGSYYLGLDIDPAPNADERS
jgi:hypothetical protein